MKRFVTRLALLVSVMLAAWLGVGATQSVQAYDGPVYLPLGVRPLEMGFNAQLYGRNVSLTISRQRITYRYQIENYGKKAETVDLYQPVDVITRNLADSAARWPEAFGEHPLQVTMKVDGTPVAAKLEKRAIYNGTDITALLKKHNLPIRIFDAAMRDRLKALPKPAAAELARRGIAPTPLNGWQVHATYYWPQTFAPKSTSTIEISYRPLIGETVDGLLWTGEAAGVVLGLEDFASYDKLCLGKEDEANMLARFHALKPDDDPRPYDMFYITVPLKGVDDHKTTNWIKPKVKVELGPSDEMAGLCGGTFDRIDERTYLLQPDSDKTAYEFTVTWLTLKTTTKHGGVPHTNRRSNP